MKNVFARTVLALVLIPSFWMTSVGTAAAGWVDTPGETVGKMAKCDGASTINNTCSNPIQVSFTVLGFYRACVDAGSRYVNLLSEVLQTAPRHEDLRYMQFVPDYPGALSGLCYYYEAGSSSGKSGPHTWRFDY